MNLIINTEFHSNDENIFIPLLDKSIQSYAVFKWLEGENVKDFLKRHTDFEDRYDYFLLSPDEKYFEPNHYQSINISIYKVKDNCSRGFFLISYNEIMQPDCLNSAFCVPDNKFNLLLVKKYFIDLGYRIAS